MRTICLMHVARCLAIIPRATRTFWKLMIQLSLWNIPQMCNLLFIFVFDAVWCFTGKVCSETRSTRLESVLWFSKVPTVFELAVKSNKELLKRCVASQSYLHFDKYRSHWRIQLPSQDIHPVKNGCIRRLFWRILKVIINESLINHHEYTLACVLKICRSVILRFYRIQFNIVKCGAWWNKCVRLYFDIWYFI